MIICLILAIIQLLLILPHSFTNPSTFYTLLISSRVLSGFSDGVLVILYSSLTDLAKGDPIQLPINYGKVGLVFGISFTLGPLTSAVLYSQLKSTIPVLLLALFSLILSILVYHFLCHDTLPVSRRLSPPPRPLTNLPFLVSLSPFQQLKYLASPILLSYAIPFFLHELSTTVYMSWILYLEWRYSFTVPQIGIFLSSIGIVVGVFQGTLLKPTTVYLKARFPLKYETLLIVFPLLVNSIYFFILTFVTNGILYFPLLLLAGVASMSVPVLRAVVLRTHHQTEFGAINALFSTIGVCARIAGAEIFPRSLEASQKNEAFPGLLNLVACFIMVTCTLAAIRATSMFDPADCGKKNNTETDMSPDATLTDSQL
jgi:DHA1 family tetracycline resistance protein-like MFS transporter